MWAPRIHVRVHVLPDFGKVPGLLVRNECRLDRCSVGKVFSRNLFVPQFQQLC